MQRRVRLALALACCPAIAAAERVDDAPAQVVLGGYLQPQFRLRQDSAVGNDEDGFRWARVRPQIRATTTVGDLELSAFFEVELQPQFSMYDAFATVARAVPEHGRAWLDVGQMRTPLSRMQLLSDSNLSFVDKAQLGSIAPDRDLGAKLSIQPPVIADYVKLTVGSFDGEGRNQVQNINQSYLHAGRLEITPLGKAPATMQESAFAGDYLTIAASYGRNKLTKGDHHEVVQYYGADVAGAWHGLSGAFEILRVAHHQPDGDVATRTPDFRQDGWAAQLAYLIPIELPPADHARVELAVRVEEIDRNDTVPITAPGDPNQSVRAYTACASYYLRQHALKLQLAATHFVEIEDRTATGDPATYPNDQLLLQLTYRMETR